MKFGIVVFPASNCDLDAYYMVKDVMGKDAVYLWHKERDIKNVDCIILPGGFSYGDYLRCGAIARFSPVMEEVISFAKQGGLVMGICNGFQVLVEAGLLPGALYRNNNLKFCCQFTNIRVENNKIPFTNSIALGEVLNIPVAHGEGNYYVDEKTLKEMENNGQIVFRYANPEGEVVPDSNPNGSVSNVAGVCNLEGNVLGMMPHPERAGEKLLGSQDGRKIFESIIEHWGARQ